MRFNSVPPQFRRKTPRGSSGVPPTNLTKGLVVGTTHFQTLMPSPGFVLWPNGTAVSVTNHMGGHFNPEL
ncbi:hypothetical protein TNCV_2367141 [Trichonephila clavipes]|nr:hypothetical protein TNCV_2367141 [Trichonephila clavipes]